MGLSPNLWGLVLSLGRQHQNWAELQDTPLVPKNCSEMGGVPTYTLEWVQNPGIDIHNEKSPSEHTPDDFRKCFSLPHNRAGI